MKLTLGRNDLATAAAEAVQATGTRAERVDVKPVHKASKGFVNEGAVAFCEIAIVTLLQAVALDKPVTLLPISALTRPQHQTLVTLGDLAVDEIEGHRVGVRSWSQTTGVWVRGFLTEQFGLDLQKINWTTYEGAHVDGVADPVWVDRAPDGAKLPADFLAGKVDFGILGNELPEDPRIRTASPDARAVAARWSATKGFTPVNHVVGLNPAAAKENSAAVLAAYDAMRAVVGDRDAGFAPLRAPFTQAAAYALDQDVIPRAVEFDELVDRTSAALGVPPSRLGA
jgi:4,5-dihydroxyphthalate decarboxylase